MQLNYKNFRSELTYCGKTKGYYGELVLHDEVVILQASNRQHAMQLMQLLVDQFLQQQQCAAR